MPTVGRPGPSGPSNKVAVVNLLTRQNPTKLLGERFLNIDQRMLTIEMADDEIGWVGQQQRHLGVAQRITDINSRLAFFFDGNGFDIAESGIV